MRPCDISCRLCGIDYSKTEGCVTCRPAKANIEWPAMKDQDVRLLPLAQKAIRLMELNLDRLEKEMTESLGGRSGHYFAEHAKEAAMLSRSIAFILGEARKLEERDEKKLENMTFEQQCELWFEFIRDLPAEHQKRVATHIAGLLEAGEETAELVDE